MEDVIGDWKKQYYEKLRVFYSSPNISQAKKLSSKIWRSGKGRTERHRGFRWENLKERNNLKDTEVVGRIILNAS
jgi:hypothetical protein